MAGKLFDELASRYENRDGGYTRVLKAGFRYGDLAPWPLRTGERDPDAKGQNTARPCTMTTTTFSTKTKSKPAGPHGPRPTMKTLRPAVGRCPSHWCWRGLPSGPFRPRHHHRAPCNRGVHQSVTPANRWIRPRPLPDGPCWSLSAIPPALISARRACSTWLWLPSRRLSTRRWSLSASTRPAIPQRPRCLCRAFPAI